jgi:divalent metal cation (Fe/Co/Zn/Cd) transporter
VNGARAPSLRFMAPGEALALPRPDVLAPDRGALMRRARMLSWLGLVWIAAEGAVGVAAGLAAGSVALIGFGADSVIEGLASFVIIWRFTGARQTSDRAETRAQRLVAVQFFLLAPWVAYGALSALLGGHHAETSWVGIAMAVTSAIGMPLLGTAKRRVGEQLGSDATRGEGMQNVLCGYLAAALLLGLVGNAAFGLWWLDPAVALLIAGVAVSEGRSAWRGKGCCVAH